MLGFLDNFRSGRFGRLGQTQPDASYFERRGDEAPELYPIPKYPLGARPTYPFVNIRTDTVPPPPSQAGREKISEAMIKVISPMVASGIVKEEDLSSAIKAVEKTYTHDPMTEKEQGLIAKMGSEIAKAKTPKWMPLVMWGGVLARGFLGRKR